MEDETRVTAHLPNLDLEMTRRRSPDGGAEVVTLQLRATPSLDAAAPMLLPLLAMNPFLTAWAQAVEQMWAPWTKLLLPPQR